MFRGKRPAILAVSIAGLIGLWLAPQRVHGQTWTGATSGDWNTATNWNPVTTPNANGSVTFGAASNTTISFSTPSGIGSLTFTASATSPYTFQVTPAAYFYIGGAGITNNSGVTQNFEATTDGLGNFGRIFILNTATAGSMTQFTTDGGTVNGGGGSALEFSGLATAGSASIINQGGTVTGAAGGTTNFDGSSKAGSATITTNGGSNGGGGGATYFTGTADGGTARAITNGNGIFDISQLQNGGMKIGSIEGSGNYFLGANTLTVGGNNLSTNVSGVIADGGLGGGTGGALIKAGTGTLTLTAANTYTGSTTITAGTLQLGTAGTAGALDATGTIGVNSGATFQVVNAGSNATVGNNIANGVSGVGTLNMNSANTNTLTGTLTNGAAGTLALAQNGSGVTILANAANTYTGTTAISGGTLQLGDNGSGFRAGSIGANSAVTIGGGGVLSLYDVSGNSFSNTVTGILGGSGTVQILAASGSAITVSGTITGQVGLTASGGTGIVTSAANFYSGGTTVTNGATLQVGTATTAGTLGIATAVSVNKGGVLVFTNPTNNVVQNDISNGVQGVGTVVVNSPQTVTVMGKLSDGASGQLGLNVNGPGTTVLTGTNTYTGTTLLQGGTLQVSGSIASGVTVDAGTLTGTGQILGSVTLSGGTLVPGTITNVGTANVGGLNLLSGNVNFRLGQPTGNNDLVNVTGNLAIGGNLNVSPQSGFTAGTYTLFDYSGALSTNGSGFVVGRLVGYNSSITTGAGQVQLQVSYVGGGQFWDGSGAPNDGTISGGTGNWGTTGNNWTNSTGTANSTWKSGTAVFGGTSGTVTLTSGVSAQALIFNSNGYTISGSQNLTLAGSAPAIVASTTGIKNTIAVPLVGTHGLTVGGVGTVVLTNTANTYTGGTTVDGGNLQIGDVISAGSVGPGTVSVGNGGTFALWKLSGTSFTNNVTNNVGGVGTVETTFLTPMTFSGTFTDGVGQLALDISLGNTGQAVTLTNAHNTYSGLTTVSQNTLQIGTATAAGSIGASSPVQVHIGGTLLLVNVAGNTFANNISNEGGSVGTINVNSTNTNTLSGTIADGSFGTLTFTQAGTGTTILTNTDSFSGATSVTAGTLQIGNGSGGNLTGTSGVTIANSASVVLNLADGTTFSQPIILGANTTAVKAIQSGTSTITGLISGTGTFNQNGTGTTVLKAAETYTGATHVNAGTLVVDGSLAAGSAVSIGTAGTLLGAGTIGGNVTMTGNGTINLGTSGNIVGTLGISGGNWNGAGSVGGVVTSSSGVFNLNGKLTASSGLSVTGGTLAGTGILTGNLNYGSGSSSTFDGLITGTGVTLTKGGSSTLVLTFSNSYTGATTVTAGTLQVGNGSSGSLATSGVTVSGSGVFATDFADGSSFAPDINLSASTALLKAIQSGTTTFNGVISGPGGLNQNGTGTTILPNPQTYTGVTTVSGGTLEVDSSLAAGSTVNVGTAGTLTGTGTVQGKATLTGNGTINFTGGNIVSTLGITGGNWNGVGSVGGLVTSSSGAFNLNGTLTAPAGLSVTGGTLAGTGTVTGNVNYASSSNSTFGGIIDGAGATLTKAGTSTLILNGGNTYTGATTITAGTLQMGDGSNGSFATSSVTVSGTGALATDFTTGTTFAPNINLSATGTSLKAIQSGTNTFSGVISGLGAFSQNGTGTTILSNPQTYTGLTTVSGGTLEVDSSLAAGSTVNVGTAGTLTGTGTVQGKATLTGNGTINFTGGNIIGTLGITGGNWSGVGSVGGLVTSSSGAFNLNGTLTAPAGLSVTGGTLAGTGTVTGNVSYASSSNSTFGGVIAGAGALTKAGTSTLILNGVNTYTGTTTITAGTLQMGDGSNGGLSGTSGVTVSGTGVFVTDLATGLSFAPNINLGAATALLKAIQSGTNTLNGVISGTGGLNQNGIGTTILTKIETYTGVTAVNAGTLEVDGFLSSSSVVNVGTAGTLTGTGTVRDKATLTGNGTIDFGTGGNIVGTLAITGGNWSGAGSVGGAVTSSSGAFTLNGNLTAPAGLTVSGGTWAGTGTMNGKVNYTSTSSSTFGGSIGGSGITLTKAGTSTLILNGTNTYTGATTITAGTLQIGDGSNGSLANTSGITVSGSGAIALDLANGSTFSTGINLSAAGASVKAMQTGTTTLTSAIGGAGGLTQNGSGKTILPNPELYTGVTTVSAGTLEVDGSLSASSVVNVNGTGTLSGTGTVRDKATLTGNGTIDFGLGGNIIGTLGITGGNWTGVGTVGGAVTSSSGVFNLNGSMTAPVGLTVSGGTLAGTGTVTGKVNYKSTSNSTFGGVIAGSGATLTKAGTSTLTLTGANTYTGATTVTAGTLQVGNGTATAVSLGSSTVTVASGGTLALNLADGASFANNVTDTGHITDIASSGTHTISGIISGAGTFTKTGASTVSLTRANTYTGATTISGGTLLVNNTTGFGTGTGTVSVNSGGILGGDGSAKAVTLNNGGIIAPGAASPAVAGTTLHASSLMWNAGGTLKLQLGTGEDALALTGALTKGSAGTYTLDLVDAGIAPGVYPLATFASTNFLTTNFTLEMPAGYDGTLVETSTSLSVDVSLHSSSDNPGSLILSDESASPISSGGAGTLVLSGASFSSGFSSTVTLNRPLFGTGVIVPISQASIAVSGPVESSPLLVASAESSTPTLDLTPAPEPGSAVLVVSGVSMLLGWRRRRAGTKSS